VTGSEQSQDNVSYQEREAVAIFDSENALRAAVDALMQIGLRQDDLSLLGDVSLLRNLGNIREIEDAAGVRHAAYVSSDERTEGLSAVVGAPTYVIGAGAAAIVATGGAALIPTIAVAAGGAAVGGALGLLLARAFGRRHADRVEKQLAAGGLLLWVHAPDPEKDQAIISALTRNGGRDVHIHVVERTWGPADAPLHDFNPDPLLEKG